MIALLLLLQLALAQTQFDAFVKIIDQDLAGQLGTYRFTIDLAEGHSIQVTLPPSITYEGSSSTKVDVCRQYLASQTINLQNCHYNQSKNMITFPLPSIDPGFFVFDLGPIRNPLFSQLLSGFLIEILDNSNTAISASNPFAVFVNIQPNFLTNQLLVVDSLKVAAITNYHFSFTTTNPVPAGGFIEIIFPSTQIQVPSTAPVTQLTVSGSQQTLTASATSSSSLTFRVDSGIPAMMSVRLDMNQVNNPNTISETNSFTLRTLTNAGKTIDQVQTGLTVHASQPAEIQVDQMSVSQRRVGAFAQITFKITLPTTYSQGGSLTVNLPDTVTIDASKLSCLLFIGFSQDQGYCNMPSASKINLYAPINQPSLTFAISGFVNPPNTKPTLSFTFQAFDPQGNTIMQSISGQYYGYTPTVGTLQTPSITRQILSVGSPTAVNIGFKTQNNLKTGEFAVVTIPKSHFLVVNAVPTCSSKTQYDASLLITTCTLVQTATDFTVTFPVNCSSSAVGYCTAGITISLQISSGLQNLNWISSATTSASITTMTSDLSYQIDQAASAIFSQPALVPGMITSMQMTKQLGVVGQETTLQVKATLTNMIPASGTLQIVLPDNSLQEPLSTLACTSSQQAVSCSYNKYASGYVNTISVVNPCGAQCSIGQSVDIIVDKLRNPKSVKPITNSFTVATYTAENYAIDSGVISNAQGLDVSVAPMLHAQVQSPSPSSQIITGALTTYSVAISPTNGIQPTTGKLVLTFPPEISMSAATTCAAYQDVTMVLLNCVVSGQQFIVTHSIPGQTFQGSQLIVQGTKMKNPPSTKPSDIIKVQSYLTVGSTAYLVDQDLTSLTVTSNTPNQLISGQVTRSNAIVNQPADLQVCWTPFNPIPVNSVMKISIPTDQAIFGNSVTTSITLVSVANQVLTLVVPQVAAGNQSCFSVSGVQNPSTTKPSVQSITLNLQTSDGYKIDTQSAGIFTQPYLSAGPFQSLVVNSSNSIVSQQTTLTVKIGLQSGLSPGNMIQLTLPPSLYYKTYSPACQVQSESPASCEYQTASDTIGTYYTQITHIVTSSYAQGQVVMLTITGLINKFTTMPFQGSILVQSLDSAGYTVNSSSQTLSLTYEVNPNAQLSATRTNQVVQKATTLQISLTLATRLQSGSDLTVMIPDTVLTNPAQVKVNLAGQLVFSTITKVTNSGVVWYAVKIALTKSYADSSNLQLEIFGFKNCFSTKSSVEGITAKTSLNDFDIDVTSKTQISGDLVPTSVSISNPKLSATIVGQQTDLSFNLIIDGLALAGNSVEIKFPGQVVLFSSKAAVVIGSSQINSQIQQDQSGYLLKIAFTLPQDVTQSIVVTVKNVQNLNVAKPLNFSFTATIMDQQDFVAVGQTDLDSLYLLQPVTLTKVNLVRASQTLSLLTELQIGFELPTNFVMPQSTVQVLIPTSEFTLTGQCQANLQATCAAQPSSNDMIRIFVSNVCSTGCAAGQRISITVSGAVVNSSKATLTLVQSQIVLSNNGYQIGIASTTVTPGLQVPGLSSLQVSQDVAITGQVVTNLVVGFNLLYSQPGATKININLPSSTFIYNQTQCFFVKNGVAKEIYCTAESQAPQPGLPPMAQSVFLEELGGLLDTSLNQVCIRGLRNIDYVRDRDSANSFTVSLLAENNQIIVQSSVNELLLPKLVPATLSQLSFTRKSSKIGEVGVNYLLTITMPTYLRVGAYMVITIPQLQAIVVSNSISCLDSTTLSSLNCQVTSSNGDQVIKVTNWCPNGVCQPSSKIKLAMTLNNPGQMFQGDQQVTVSMFTRLDQPVATSIGINMMPQLVGVALQEVTLQRKSNVLGQMDTLKLFIPDIRQSIISQTDLILVLPDGITTNQSPSCFRILRQVESQVACEILDTYDGGSIRRVIFHSVCDQQYICLAQDNLELWISGGTNPSSNVPISDQSASISLKTPQGQDVGFASFTVSLPAMSPSVIQISSTVGNCTTLLICPMTVTLELSNPLMKGGYVVFTSPVNFTSYECQAGSDLTCQVLTRNTVKITADNASVSQVTASVTYAQMPSSTEPSGDFKATSFENLGRGKVMILDQGAGGGFSLDPSRFKQFDVVRSSNIIGELANLQFVFTTYIGREDDSLFIQVPVSSGIISQSACSRNSKPISCQVQGQTITINKVGSVCKTSSSTQLACRFQVTNVKNPDYFIIQNESSVKAELTTSNRYQVQLQHDKIIVTPALAPMYLEISMPIVTPDSSNAAQEGITLSFQAKLPVTSSTYLMVEFDQTNYVPYASLFSNITVMVNQEQAPLVAVTVGEIQGSVLPIKLLTIALPLNQDVFSVQISGLTNPMFTKQENLLECKMTVSSAISIARYLARNSINFSVKLAPSVITPISAYLVSPFIGQTTFLQVAFNLNSYIQQGDVQIVLPSDFRMGSKSSRQLKGQAECWDISSGHQLGCSNSGQTISVQFNRTPGPYNGFTLRVGPITNPRLQNNYTFSIQVQNQTSIFGSGSFVVQTHLQGKNCTDCLTCTQTGQCVTCPIDLILSNGVCVQTCPKGSYELDGRCFACVGDCAQCQRQDTCSVCKSGKRLAGMCSADCPLGFTQNDTSCLVDPSYDGNPWVDTNSTASKIFSRANLNDTKNKTSPRIFEMGMCTVDGCNSCSINPDYCDQCSNGFIIADGRCFKNCPSGMFEALGECFKCNSACSTCETNANTCLSCKPQSLFVPGYSMCVRNECPGGTYKLSNATQCAMCSKECNTCADASTCSSCFTDLTTGKDMFFTKDACSESCPFLSSKNIETHVCEVLGIEDSQYLPMVIPIIALLTTVGAHFISHQKSAGAHEPYGIAIAFLTQFQVLNWVILAGMLWPTTNTAQFVVVAVVLMANAGLGIYTRWTLDLKVARSLQIVSQITGPNTLRLSFSNFCGVKSDQQDPNSILQFEKICIAQAGLVLAQTIAGLVLPLQFGPQDAQFGLGLNCAVFGLTQIGLQFKLYRQIMHSLRVYMRVSDN